MKRLLSKLKTWLKSVITQLKDRTNIIIFACVLVVVYSPTWLCGLLGIIFKKAILTGIATAYAAFWAGPFTPFWGVVFAVTFGIRKIIDRIRKGKKGDKNKQ